MDKQKLFDSFDGLFAYDTGCVDFGIKDEILREEVKVHLDNLEDEDFRLILSEFIREYFLIDEKLKQGYGIEDVNAFIEWLDTYMDISL